MCSPVLDLKSQRFLSRANLCLLGCFLLAGLLYLTLDNVVQLIVLSGFSLQKGGEFTEIWKNPPPDLFLRVNYFNLTNPEEFFSGRERAVVKEVGPYSYRQRWARKILTWNDEDNTISYSIRKVYTFLPEKSIGGQDDVITTANIPAVSAYYQMRDANFFTALGLNMVVESLEYKPWVRRTVGELSWGYEEPLFKLASYTLPSPPPFEKFGLFTGKNNSELPTFYTMHTGRDDFRKFSHIFEADGKEQMGFWGSEECDHVKGSDGGAFNPYISKEDELRLFDRQICRSIPMRYVKEVISEDGLPGYRFVPLAETLLHPRTHPENECFCRDPDICKLIGDGMYDLSSCQYGAPIVLSWPHFMNATLPDGVCTAEGMSPDPERHLMYFDVEPLTGTTLAARVRLQVNLLVKRSSTFDLMSHVNNTLLPVAWFDEGVERLGPEITDMIAPFIVYPPIMKAVLSYVVTTLALAFAATSAFILVRSKRDQSTTSNSTQEEGEEKDEDDEKEKVEEEEDKTCSEQRRALLNVVARKSPLTNDINA